MLAIAGVSDDPTKVVGIVVLFTSARLANSCCSKPTGSAGSNGVGPVKLTVLPAGTGASALQAPKLAVASVQLPDEPRCSDRPTGEDVLSSAPMLVEVRPAAGPLVATNTPSYDRNSTTPPDVLTSAMASGPFWMPFEGYGRARTPRPSQLAGSTPEIVAVPYGAPPSPL